MMHPVTDDKFDPAEPAERLRKAAELLDVSSSCERMIEALRESFLLRGKDTFTIVVCGEFNRGKSTLVNALCGKPLLPAGVLPTTRLVCRVEFAGGEADGDEFFIEGEDGCTEVPPSEVTSLIHAGGEATLVVRTSSSGLPEGTVLIDTPGLNELDKAASTLTLRQIPKASAALVVLDAASPLRASEKAFIERKLLRLDYEKVWIVVNKCDLLDDDSLEDVENFVRGRLPRECREHLYMISAARACSGENLLEWEAFLGALRTTIARAEDMDRKTALRRARTLLRRLSSLARLHEKAVRWKEDRRRETADKLRAALKEVELRKREVDEKLKQSLPTLEEILERRLASLRHSIRERLEMEVWCLELEPSTSAQLAADIVEEEYKKALEAAGEELERRTKETARALLAATGSSAHTRDLAVAFEESLGAMEVRDLEDELLVFDLGAMVLEGLTFAIGGMLLGVVGLIPAFFGARMFKNMMKEYKRAESRQLVTRNVERFLDKTFHQVREQWRGRITDMTDDLRARLHESLDARRSELEERLRLVDRPGPEESLAKAREALKLLAPVEEALFGGRDA